MNEQQINTNSNNSNRPMVVINPMTHYKPESVRWLEDGRIAMGKLTLVAGDPGLGKSFMTLELAARVSRGEAGRRENGLTGHTVIMSAEDDPNDTLVPRLDAMCASMKRVHFMEGMRKPNDEHIDLIQLDRDTDILIDAIVAIGDVSLVVIDPISAYMGRADSHNNAEVRSVLAQLSRLAQKTGSAVVCVTHLNKDSSGKRAVYRAMGSLAFTAAARTVHLVTKHPKRDDDPYVDRKRVVSMVKNNLGPIAPARVYIIDDGILIWLDDEIDMDADALDGSTPDGGILETREGQSDKAIEFLEDMLAYGGKPVSEIFELGVKRGINKRTLQRAREQIGAIVTKQGRIHYWSPKPSREDEMLIREAIEPEPPVQYDPNFGQDGFF